MSEEELNKYKQQIKDVLDNMSHDQVMILLSQLEASQKEYDNGLSEVEQDLKQHIRNNN